MIDGAMIESEGHPHRPNKTLAVTIEKPRGNVGIIAS